MNITTHPYFYPILSYIFFTFMFIFVDLPHFTCKGFWCKIVLTALAMIVGAYSYRNIVEGKNEEV